MASIVFSITYIPMTFLAIKMFRDFKVSSIFYLATILAIFGSWIRVVAELNNNFYWVLTGFVLISLSYPFFLSSIT